MLARHTGDFERRLSLTGIRGTFDVDKDALEEVEVMDCGEGFTLAFAGQVFLGMRCRYDG